MNQRVPPCSEEAEKGILGSIILEGVKCFDIATANNVTESTFYIPAHKLIWESVMDLGSKGKPIDAITITQALIDSGRLEAIGGTAYLDKIVDSTPTAANCEYYCNVAKDKELLRKIIAAAREAEDEAYTCENPESLRSQCEYIFAVMRSQKNQKRGLKEIVEAKMKAFEEAKTKKGSGIPTGFRLFDRHFAGVQEALTVLSGEAGCGKTTLARNIIENLAMRGFPVEYFTTEQTDEQLVGNSIGRMGKQSVFFLNQGSEKCDWGKVVQGAEAVKKWPLTIHDQAMTPTLFWSECRRAKTKRNAQLVVLDYLQDLVPDKKYNSGEEKISDFIGTCKRIVKELRLPMIVISTLSNAGTLRGSGQILYDVWAHAELTKHPDWSESNLVYRATVKKNRFGPNGGWEDMILLGNEQRFTDIEESQRNMQPINPRDMAEEELL